MMFSLEELKFGTRVMWSFWAILDASTVQTRNGKLTTKMTWRYMIFGIIQTRGTIHEYSLFFEEAFKDLSTFKILFSPKTHQIPF